MSQQGDAGRRKPAENFGVMIKAFGDALGEIFNDPELKEKARSFGDSAVESAKILASNLKDEDTKAKFREVGKAAEDLGKSIKDCFKIKRDE